jgi:cytochrome c biogenesis factor
MGFGLLITAIACVLLAALLPVIFLRRHPGKKMDETGYRSWLVWTFALTAVALIAIVLILTVTKSIDL